MGLWVKSQNGGYIGKINEVHIEFNRMFSENVSCFVASGDLILGKYQTIERALEIADNIEYFLRRNSKKIYKMPKK